MRCFDEPASRGSGPSSALDGVPEAADPLVRARQITEAAARVGFDWPDWPSVRSKLDEEIGELDQALRDGEPDAIADELGDVLFTLVNLARFLPTDASVALSGATTKFERRFRAMEQAIADEGRTVEGMDIDTLEARWQQAKLVVR